MFAQIVAIFIFLGMFLLIILDKFERHYVTLGSGAERIIVFQRKKRWKSLPGRSP